MKIVILGGGKVGEELCRDLSDEGNDIIIIDKDERVVERLISKSDISGVIGNGASYSVLMEANTDKCDIFIAVTHSDEINIIAVMMAKKLGAKYTIVRVRNPEYSSHHEFMRESLNVNMLINPEWEAAKDISRIVRYPSAFDVEGFAGGRVQLVGVELNENSPLIGKSIAETSAQLPNIVFCVIDRDGDVFLPEGQTILQKHDRVYATGDQYDLRQFYKLKRLDSSKIKSLLIIGGGTISFYLIRLMTHFDIHVKVIETNYERCEKLSQAFPEISVIHGDGTDQEFLEEEQISNFDCVVSLTGIDEENVMISMFSVVKNVPKTITKVNRTSLLKLFTHMGLQSIITPKRIISSRIIRFVRALVNSEGSNVEALYRFADNKAEALQFFVKEGSKIINKPIKDLQTKTKIIFAFILRNKTLIYPKGSDMILPNDRIIIITTKNSYDDIDDILK